MSNEEWPKSLPLWTETLLRVWCLVWLLGWQGGFAFYSGVVVPVGSDVLGSELEQGWVTRSVTPWLNGLGGVGIASCFVALKLTRWSHSKSTYGRWSKRLAYGIAGYLTLSLLALIWVHGQVDLQLDPRSRQVVDYDAFYQVHRIYLILSTTQWLTTIVLAGGLIHGWTQRSTS